MDPTLFGYSQEDFKEEAKELLGRAESILAEINESPQNPDCINALFRTIHSLKGSASYVGLPEVSDFSHLYESFLGDLRNRTYDVTDDVLTVLLRGRDYLEDLIFNPEDTLVLELDESIEGTLEGLKAAFEARRAQVPSVVEAPAEEEEEKNVPAAGPPQTDDTGQQNQPAQMDQMDQVDVINLTVKKAVNELYDALKKTPMEAESVKNTLSKLENTVHWAFGDEVLSILIPLEEMKVLLSRDPLGSEDVAMLKKGFNILVPALKQELKTLEPPPLAPPAPSAHEDEEAEGEEANQEVTLEEEEQAGEGSEIREATRDEIVRITLSRAIDSLSKHLDEEPLNPVGIKKVLNHLRDFNRWAFNEDEQINSAITEMEDLLMRPDEEGVLPGLKAGGDAVRSLFQTLVEEKETLKEVAGAPSPPSPSTSVPAVVVPPRPARSPGRTPAAPAVSTLKVRSDHVEALINTVSGIKGLEQKEHESLHAATLELRMVPVGDLFNRFRKIVRDLSEELDKPIALEISGESVKLDKTIADRLNEPLLHMVRNAASHGIEAPEERRAAGKEQAAIKLNAYQEGGQIVIEVIDNGRGINFEKVRERAVEMGLVEETDEKALSEKRLLDIIFAPGFSTKQGADRLSGRGVGTDVIKEVMASVQGSVSINTNEGVGTTFTLRLPLTLAVIRAMVLEQSGNKIAVATGAVDRIINMTEDELSMGSFMDKNRAALYLADEGEILPLMNFSQLFGLDRTDDKRCVVLVKVGGGHKVALVVDAALGRQPLAVKPLDRFSETRYFSSAAFFEDEVVLILNISSLMAA